MRSRRAGLPALLCAPAGVGLAVDLAARPAPVTLGLAAAMSGGSAASGEVIRRGLAIATDEVNASGGCSAAASWS